MGKLDLEVVMGRAEWEDWRRGPGMGKMDWEDWR